MPKLITIKEAAAIAGVTTRTIERRLSAGSLRTYKTGHRTLVDEGQVRDLFLTIKPARKASSMNTTDTQIDTGYDRLLQAIKENA